VVRLTRYRFKLKDKDKLRVNLKHVVYYTLLWIACVDNMCNMYRVPKDNNWKYPVRIYWALEEKWFRNAKYIHSWHLVEV